MNVQKNAVHTACEIIGITQEPQLNILSLNAFALSYSVKQNSLSNNINDESDVKICGFPC